MQNNFPKIPLIFAILLFSISSTIFVFLYREINNNHTKSEVATAAWQEETARRDDIRMLNNSIKSIEEDRTSLETHFAQSSDIVPFLDTIEKLASSVGAKASIAAVNVASDNSGLLAGVNVEGSFTAVYKFITLLENSPYELSFSSVDIKKQTDQTTVGKVATEPQWQGVLEIKLLSFLP